jgi:hypothetical protein
VMVLSILSLETIPILVFLRFLVSIKKSDVIKIGLNFKVLLLR